MPAGSAAGPPGTGPVILGPTARDERIGQANPAARRLSGAGVTMVALCWVDNAGIARAKTIPLGRLERAAGWGVGMSPVFDVFLVNDDITTSEHIGGPGGDLRLVPDLDRLTVLAGQPGWAWAPVDRYTQEGRAYAACQRSFARRMVGEAARRGLELRAAFEVEWAIGTEDDGQFVPACRGPAYGMTRVIELSDYGQEVVGALERQGITVEQFHLFSAFLAVRRAEIELFADVSPPDIVEQTAGGGDRWRRESPSPSGCGSASSPTQSARWRGH